MNDPNFIDEQRNADYLDALADRAYELEEAMRESEEYEWDEIDEISLEDDTLTFTALIDGQMSLEVSASIADDEFQGDIKAGDFGTFPIMGKRTSTPE